MADRPQQNYPLMAGFNNGMNNMNNMMQQQGQHPQQQQQGDMHPNQPFGGLWNQNMQQQQQQQPQFRPRSGAGMPSQNQAQMNEIMRGHNMARVPSGQQQPMNFALGVGVPNIGNQLPFHDQPSNQPNMNGGAFGAMQNPAMQQRQNNLLQSMPPSGVRQLEMMMQNPTSMNFAKLPQASQQASFPNTGVNPNPQGDLFSSPSMSNAGVRGPSPSHPQNINMMPIMPPNGNPIQAPQRRNLTSTEFGDRTNQLRLAVQNQEATYNKIKSNPAFNTSAELQQRAKQILDDLTQKRQYLSHMMQRAMNNQSNMAGQGVNPGGNGWMAPPNPNAAGRPPGPPTPIPPQSSPHPSGAAQSSPSLGKPQPPGPQQAGLPQRTEATPQPPSQGPQMGHLPQQPSGDAGPNGGPFQIGGTSMNGAASGMGQTNPNGMPNGGPGGMASINSIAQLISSIPPLEPGTFENNFKLFSQRRNRPFNPQLLLIENRQVDLQRLHAIVMQEGGAAKIEQRGAWDVVGGKLGFVQFPGTESEPSKSGPGVALQISTMYREYLQAFDTVYLSSTLESRNKVNGPGTANVHLVAAMFTGSVTPNGMGGANGPASVMLQAQARARAQVQQMTQLVPFAYLPAAELRSRGIPEQYIQAVEQNRALLQRAHDDQTNYSRGLRGQPQPPGLNSGLQQPGMPPMRPDQQQNGAPADTHQGNGMGPSGVQLPFGGPVQGGQGHMPNRGMQMGQNLIQGGMPNGMNPMDRPQGPPFGQVPPASLPHQMQPGMGQNTNTHEQFQLAMAYISRVKTEFVNNSLPNMNTREVPPEHRAQFNATLEQLHRQMADNESKLPMYFMLLNNSELIKKLVLISCTVAHQRQLLSGGSNRHIVSLETMRNMMIEVSKINDMCTAALRASNNRRQLQMQQQALLQQNQMKQPHQPMQPGGVGMSSPANLSGPETQRGPMPANLGPNIPPPPSSIPPPVGAHHTPNLANQTLRGQPLSLNQPPPPRRVQPPPKVGNGTPGQGISSPSPAPPANASTPTHNAPTPNTMGSPQIPKSPKTKPTVKKPQRANQRRPSKAAMSPAASGNNAPTPQSHASPEMSTPVPAPATIKRQREDEQVGPSPGPSGDHEGVANGPSPPKRMKMEPPSSSAILAASQPEKPGEPLKKGPEMASEVSHIKTPQQSTEFLEEMTELLRNVSSSSTEGQSGASPEQFGETLEMLLKSVGGETDVMSNGFESFPNAPSPGAGQTLSFDDLFDFSNMADEEDYKDTPDLIRSSSTNPSPESNNSEGDQGMPSSSVKVEPKTEDFSSDVMPPGLWKEIDGGEAGYFQSSDWKWDGQMSTVEQPWAIY